MRKKRRKGIAAALAGLAVIGICILEPSGSAVPAKAADSTDEQSAGSMPVVVSWETTEKKFRVTVPTSVKVTLGTYTATCSQLYIKNNSSDEVCIRQVEIKNGVWTLDGYSGDSLRYRPLDSKYLGFQMKMGDDSGITLETQTVAEGVTSQIWRADDDADTAASTGELRVTGSSDVVIEKGETLDIDCKVRATAVTNVISADNPDDAASIIFIIGWYD
jgi:hypothetical protein